MYKCVDERGVVPLLRQADRGLQGRAGRHPADSAAFRPGNQAASGPARAQQDADFNRRQIERERQDVARQGGAAWSAARACASELAWLSAGTPRLEHQRRRRARLHATTPARERAPGAAQARRCAAALEDDAGCSSPAPTRPRTRPRRAAAPTSSSSSSRISPRPSCARRRASCRARCFDRWREAGAIAAVRINPLETCGNEDLLGVLAGRPDLILMSKVVSARAGECPGKSDRRLASSWCRTWRPRPA